MIANLLNVVIGLWLAHIAIFGAPVAFGGSWLIVALGIAAIALALAARRSDFSPWQSTTNVVVGVILVVVTLLDQATAISPLVTFWIDLWAGVTVASLALWATLYHPAAEQAPTVP